MTATSNKTKSNRLMIVMLVMAVSVLSVWLYKNLEYELVKNDKGFQGEARNNDYLAAEFFLRRMGYAAEKVSLFTDKEIQLNNTDTLLVPSVRLAFDRLRSRKMLDWVSRGGHLILTGQPALEAESSYHDHIFEEIGLSIERKVLKKDSTQYEFPVDVSLDGYSGTFQINFDDYLVITTHENFNSPVLWTIEDEDRVHAMQFTWGSGKITLLSDMKSFKNTRIDSYDHAAFLLSLNHSQTEMGVFYYSLYEGQMSLLQWLWENARHLMLSLITVAIIVLWMLIPRFGPIINVNLPVRRQFLDHLKASGNYHWRQGNYSRLLLDVQKQLSQQIKFRYPEWLALSRQDKILHLVELSQLQADAVESALFDLDVERVNDFVNKIKILEKLRKCL